MLSVGGVSGVVGGTVGVVGGTTGGTVGVEDGSPELGLGFFLHGGPASPICRAAKRTKSVMKRLKRAILK